MAGQLGRLAPDPTKPRLRLGARLDRGAPAAPPLADWLSRVADWPMYGNDRIGDCTIAGAGHIIQALSTYGQGTTATVGDDDVLAAYSAVSGYDPLTGRNDNGAVMQDVLNYWRRSGIGGHRILAFAEVDVRDRTEVERAISVFGHVYIGIDMPTSAMDQFDAGRPWDVVRRDGGLEGGHAVNVGAYSRPGAAFTAVTWGRVQALTEAFWDRYVAEAWVIITPEWLSAAGTSPGGVDLYGLGEDLAELTGGPNPFPAPEPPGPVPGPVPEPVGPAPVVVADVALATAMQNWLHAKGLAR